ncbi:amidase [Calidifontimicrobium sp. SYSU G02091]|uniref:amidase n=1 Tax=Calidifontimicrobium sp. SYSU G02091 TaxID=2926421 RepID=UPI001F53B3A4|nr:amidase [Calidifontimicrobium sp. SYSU G02091]MCI1190842.1 amidase [Calidifontimicrobium sp. SYSU G02091]
MAADAAALTALEARERLAAGTLTAGGYADALLARIGRSEPAVQAWAALDAAHVRAQAAALDALPPEARHTPLFGLPVGLKDIVDTADLPTENGTVLHAGRQPRRDAVLVQRLRAAGAVVMGKTVTTELATYAPGKTRNPHRTAHTPGGSSSGSAAAVAAGHVPLAVGTQTNGSVIRPASFCGVVGVKPTFGRIARTGVLVQSPSFDHVGVFARSVPDAALLVQVLAGADDGDPATRPRATPPLLDACLQPPPAPPRLGWFPGPFRDRVAADARAAFEALRERLAPHLVAFELPADAHAVVADHRLVMEAEIAGSFDAEYERGREHLSASLRGQIERGRQTSAVAHRHALARLAAYADALDAALARVDAVLTPAALGTAPAGLASTGDPILCTLWTAAGTPAVSLPLLAGADGLPLGVQLVAARDDDARLLRTARWLMDALRPGGVAPVDPAAAAA